MRAVMIYLSLSPGKYLLLMLKNSEASSSWCSDTPLIYIAMARAKQVKVAIPVTGLVVLVLSILVLPWQTLANPSHWLKR